MKFALIHHRLLKNFLKYQISIEKVLFLQLIMLPLYIFSAPKSQNNFYKINFYKICLILNCIKVNKLVNIHLKRSWGRVVLEL